MDVRKHKDIRNGENDHGRLIRLYLIWDAHIAWVNPECIMHSMSKGRMALPKKLCNQEPLRFLRFLRDRQCTNLPKKSNERQIYLLFEKVYQHRR